MGNINLKNNPQGIGGWLAFLILLLIIIGPLLDFGSALNETITMEERYPNLVTMSKWEKYKIYTWIVLIISVGIKVSAGYRLWKDHRPESVIFAIKCFWAIVLLSVIANLFIGFIILNYSAKDNWQNIIKVFIGSIVWALCWTLYLKKSVRVKNTYKTIDNQSSKSVFRSDNFCSINNLENKIESSLNVSTHSKNNIELNWWRRKSKAFRLWVFCSVLWMISFVLYVFLSEPYGYNVSDDEVLEFLVTLFCPPLFVGFAYFGYVRYVR